jgi:hypothetical protein
MFIELYSIFIPVVFLFSYLGILHGQIKKEAEENLLLHRSVHSFFLEGACTDKARCTGDSLKAGRKIIYVRKPKGRLMGDEHKDNGRDQDSFSKVITDLEEKAEAYNDGQKTGNI